MTTAYTSRYASGSAVDDRLDLAGETADQVAQLQTDTQTNATDIAGVRADLEAYTIPALSAQYAGLNAVDIAYGDTSRDSDPSWPSRTGSLSYAKEARPTGDYIGQYVSATAATTAGGVVGEWFYNTTDAKFYELTAPNVGAEIFRAGSATFPAQVVVVAEADRVIIFDASGSELAMWMVFLRGVDYAFHGSSDRSCIATKEGVLAVGAYSNGVAVVNFSSDEIYNHYYGGNYSKKNGYISDRNTDLDYVTISSTTTIQNTVNDIAITTLPDAPTDPATGLKKTTTAVGTDGNGTYLISVITDDDTVYDIGADGGFTCTSVSIGADYPLTAVRSDGTIFIWNDIGAINADGVAPDTTISPSATATLGTVTIVEAA